jgi:hypothetical protein
MESQSFDDLSPECKATIVPEVCDNESDKAAIQSQSFDDLSPECKATMGGPPTRRLRQATISSCNACPAGQVSNSSGSTNCKSCQKGKYQLDSMQTTCFDCVPGRFNKKIGRNSSCEECATGMASAESGRETECEKCGLGRFAENAGSVKCSACQAGQFIDPNNTANCIVCPVGWAQPNQNRPSCLLCGRDEEKDNGATTTEPGKANCQLCDLGQFGPASDPGTCKPCANGMYQSDKGQLACVACPIDTYSSEVGKASVSDCTACPVRTTTNRLEGRTTETDCVCQSSFYLDPNSLECEPCDKMRTNCSAPNLTLATIPAASGWFRPDKISTMFYMCENKGCIGGRVEQQCASGHGGALCAVCLDGFTRQSGTCISCGIDVSKNSVSGGIIIASTVPPFLFFIVMFVSFCRKREGEHIQNADGTTQKKSTPKVAPVRSSGSKSLNYERENIPMKERKARMKLRSLGALSSNAAIIDNASLTTMTTEAAVAKVNDEVQGVMDGVIADASGDSTGGQIKADVGEVPNRNVYASIGHRVRILIGFTQVTSALVFSFDIPW